jgi:hypothetical protein
MYFDATPMNMTILLVVALAIIAIFLLSRGRYDSNLPLLYYSAALALTVMSDRGLPLILLYSGIAFALVLRFEFMGKGFTKFVGAVNSLAIGLTVLVFLNDVFGDGRALF